jgi:hypothetical protein
MLVVGEVLSRGRWRRATGEGVGRWPGGAWCSGGRWVDRFGWLCLGVGLVGGGGL